MGRKATPLLDLRAAELGLECAPGYRMARVHCTECGWGGRIELKLGQQTLSGAVRCPRCQCNYALFPGR